MRRGYYEPETDIGAIALLAALAGKKYSEARGRKKQKRKKREEEERAAEPRELEFSLGQALSGLPDENLDFREWVLREWAERDPVGVRAAVESAGLDVEKEMPWIERMGGGVGRPPTEEQWRQGLMPKKLTREETAALPTEVAIMRQHGGSMPLPGGGTVTVQTPAARVEKALQLKRDREVRQHKLVIEQQERIKGRQEIRRGRVSRQKAKKIQELIGEAIAGRGTPWMALQISGLGDAQAGTALRSILQNQQELENEKVLAFYMDAATKEQFDYQSLFQLRRAMVRADMSVDEQQAVSAIAAAPLGQKAQLDPVMQQVRAEARAEANLKVQQEQLELSRSRVTAAGKEFEAEQIGGRIKDFKEALGWKDERIRDAQVSGVPLTPWEREAIELIVTTAWENALPYMKTPPEEEEEGPPLGGGTGRSFELGTIPKTRPTKGPSGRGAKRERGAYLERSEVMVDGEAGVVLLGRANDPNIVVDLPSRGPTSVKKGEYHVLTAGEKAARGVAAAAEETKKQYGGGKGGTPGDLILDSLGAPR